jgi:single-strand DNA-binding protein
MARSINKVILLGNLTRDPIVRTTSNGTPVCDFGLATNRTYTTGKGEKTEQTEFHNIVAWGKLAEIAGKYLTKGRKVYVEGRLQTRTFETDGVKKSRTEIIIDDLVMLDGKGAETHATDTAAAPTHHSNGHEEPADLNISPEEIPF